jgi:hypothetical protein
VADDGLILSDPSTVLDPAVRAAVEMRTLLWVALNTYPTLDADDGAQEAWAWLERIAAQWRQAAQLHALEQAGDAFLPDDAAELLAALESSLALTGSDDPEHWELTLGAEEIVERMLPIGAGLWADWEQILDVLWREREHRAGRPRTDRPDSWPPVAAPVKHPRRSDKGVVRGLSAHLDAELAATAGLYNELVPDGRRLTDQERAAALERIRALAAFSRRIDLGAGRFAQTDWDLVVLSLSELRTVARNLVLAVSEDPARRRLAMSLNETRERAFILGARAQGSSWDDAYAALRAFEQANA